MRLAYFPHPHEDEALYSVVARYGRHVGLAERGSIGQLLFGSRHLVATVDLPCRLALLAERIGMELDHLIDLHTAFPYSAAFQSVAVRQATRETMAGDGRSLHFRFGAATVRSRPPTRLRFCKECVAAMSRLHGEPYWRRTHQLPGVMVCPDHGCALRESTVDRSDVPKPFYVAATETTCPADAPAVISDVSAMTLERLMAIAKASQALLAQTVSGIDDRRTLYRAGLAGLGLMRSENKVDVAAFEASLASFFGDALDHLPNTSASVSPHAWAFELLRGARENAPTLSHLLMGCFLDGATPAGAQGHEGPWKCLNPLAPHHGQMVVTDMLGRKNSTGVVGTFTCSCGYVFRRRLEAGLPVGPPLFKSYGPMLEPALRRLIRAGKGQRSVARAVGLDVKTLNRQAATLGLTPPWLAVGRDDDGRKTQAAEASMGGRAAPNAEPVARHTVAPPFNWSAADAAAAARLPGIAAEIRAVTPPLRVTLTELERRLGRNGWIRRRKQLLPLTNASVDALTETVEGFRARRVETMVRTLASGGRRPVAWYVMRTVGLDGKHLPAIRAIIERVWGRTRSEAGPVVEARTAA